MAPEPASEKQRHYLCGLLKARGVREEDCQSLMGAFPYFRSTYKKGAMLALNTKAG